MTGGVQGVEWLKVDLVDTLWKSADGTEVEPQFGVKENGVVKISVNNGLDERDHWGGIVGTELLIEEAFGSHGVVVLPLVVGSIIIVTADDPLWAVGERVGFVRDVGV